MNKSESITHLATALAKAQAEMPVAPMDATNPFLKNKYATLGSVIQASRPILAKHKLSLVQFPIGGGAPHPASGHLLPSAEKDGAQGTARPTTEFIGVESILAHESGEFVSERVLIPLVEERGKSKVQAAGSLLTYLRRYSWASILGIYAEEDTDGCAGNLPVGNAAMPRGSGSTTGNHSAKASQQHRPTLPPPPVRSQN